jgi:Tol biopolymer transport system component
MDGTHLTEVVPYSFDVSTASGDWAPSGKRFVFSNNAGHPGQTVFTEPQNIFTVRPDGTGLRQLTHYRGVQPDVSTGARSYSPDGHWIVFNHFRNGTYSLMKIHPDGTDLTRIVRSKFKFDAAAWGPKPA